MPLMALIDHLGLVRVMNVEVDSIIPTLHDGDVVLVDMTQRSPNPQGIFVVMIE